MKTFQHLNHHFKRFIFIAKLHTEWKIFIWDIPHARDIVWVRASLSENN